MENFELKCQCKMSEFWNHGSSRDFWNEKTKIVSKSKVSTMENDFISRLIMVWILHQGWVWLQNSNQNWNFKSNSEKWSYKLPTGRIGHDLY